MSNAPEYVTANARELARLRALVEGASVADLERPVNPHWTVAAVLAHVAFWDARALWLAEKIRRGEPFDHADREPDSVDWLNDSLRPLIDAIPPVAAARVALRIAEAADARVAELPEDRMAPMNPASPLHAFRADHRREHLDEIEAALGH